MRRSRRKGQLRRTSSIWRGSHSTIRISSLSCEASASTRPNGSLTNDAPQNSRPLLRRAFEAHAVHGGDVDAVGDGVRALDGAPGVVLRRAVLRFLRGMPADGGGIEQDVRAAQRGEARGFGIPLVPADQRRDAAELRIEGAEAEIAGREIEFLEEERIVRDVHLAVEPEQRAVGVDDRGGVVIEAGGALLEQRRDDDDAQFGAPAGRGVRSTGRGSVSARSNSRASSSRQKYCERNSSCRQTICAPCPAASRMRLRPWSRFSCGSSAQAI